MIVDSEQLASIAARREGSLADTPFPLVLHAHYLHRSTMWLQLRRKIVAKDVMIVDGVPVECRSNLAHESLDRFLLDSGVLDADTVSSLRAHAVAEKIEFAESVLRRGLLTPDEIVRQQQKSLAKKLLDGFAWSDGTFACSFDVDTARSKLPVNLAQLIVFGITRFTPKETVDKVLVDLIGERHSLNPASPYDIDELRLAPRQRAVIDALRDGPRDLEEVAVASGLQLDDFTRFVYALSMTGIIVTDKQLAKAATVGSERHAKAPHPIGSASGISIPAPSPTMCEETVERARSVRHQVPSEVLKVDSDTSRELIEGELLSFLQRYSPWRYQEPVHSAARELFLAGVEAYCRLTVQYRYGTRGHSSSPIATAIPEHCEELVDPSERFTEGLALKKKKAYGDALEHLRAASELDPQNPIYRSEVAHCRYLLSPEGSARQAMGELIEATRIDPACGLAHFYLGDIHERQGRRERAAECYRRANIYLAPDRRAIEALMRLTERFGE